MVNFKEWLEENDDYDYWGNVGAGILPIAKKTGRILLNYRSAYVNEGNTWGVWGGKVDDESTMDLKSEAKREFAEEAGYHGPIQLTPAFVFRTTGFEYHNFIGAIPDEFKPNIPPQHQWETDGYKWVTWEELLQIEPKHFGLKMLISNSGNLIQKYTSDPK